MKKPSFIVVCGPTATGKSDYAVALAKRIGGEIISADSRQIYTGLDIGSGKITVREMKGVPHHLLDVANPKRTFSVAQYQKHAMATISTILERGKIPIICGGTGFYIDAIVCATVFPSVPPNPLLRKKLTRLPLEILQQQLKKSDPRRYRLIDKQNKVRLIRALEIVAVVGKVPQAKQKQHYKVQWHYLDFPDDQLKQRIHIRLVKRIKQGMITEVQKLHKKGLSWKRLETLGLEYRFIALYLQKKISKQAMLEQLEKATWQYARRQRTWFKKYATEF